MHDQLMQNLVENKQQQKKTFQSQLVRVVRLNNSMTRCQCKPDNGRILMAFHFV